MTDDFAVRAVALDFIGETYEMGYPFRILFADDLKTHHTAFAKRRTASEERSWVPAVYKINRYEMRRLQKITRPRLTLQACRRFFAGRKSLGKQITYLSQYHSPGARAHYSADKLFDRIWGPDASGEWYVLQKPKGMRWRTYERLHQRLEKYPGKADMLPRTFFLDGDVV